MESLANRLKVLLDNNMNERLPEPIQIIELCSIIREACIDIYNPERPDSYPSARYILFQAVISLENLKPNLPRDPMLSHWNKALEFAKNHLIPKRTPAVVPISQPPSCAELAKRATLCLVEWEAWKPESRDQD